ncbi:MAG: class I SAM-dependent methyltransferase [Ginsengibacter sp.]|jgi:SAM-dependent methyltransferase
MKSWFKDWFNSPYYHQLYFKRDDKEAAQFINHLVDYLKPAKGSYMLDVACGKGRHSIQLATKGFDVTGIDLSIASIEEAQQHESDQLHFFVHDMRLPFWINYFDFAFNFFTSFGYFDTRREHDNAIRTIAQSLKPNGIFVIDYLNLKTAEKNQKPEADLMIDGVNFNITKWSDENHLYKKIIVEDDALPTPAIFMERVARFTLADFTEMFSHHQMEIQVVFGDYQFNKYDNENSPRLIIVAKKIQ